MSKNRKNQAAAVRFGPAVKAFVLCLFIGGAGVGYVQQKNQLHILGMQERECEMKIDRLRRENEGRLRTLDKLQTVSELEARVKMMNLGLVPPQPDQIVKLAEPSADASRASSKKLYAEQVVRVSEQR